VKENQMKNKSILLIAGIVAVTFLFAQTSQAQRPEKGDQNNTQRAERGKRKGDAEKRRRRPSPEMLIERFDTDGDGSLAVTELPERMQKRFEKVDADGDGFVSADELTTAFESRQGNGERNGEGKGKAKGKGKGKEKDERGGLDKRERGEGEKGKRSMDPTKLLQRMDKDGDEKISLEEAPDRFKKNFSKMDANADGFVELAELKTAMETMRQKRGEKSQSKGKRNRGDGQKPIEPKLPPVDFEL
jgi:Ca2+-binding EF-hand superfamily protein